MRQIQCSLNVRVYKKVGILFRSRAAPQCPAEELLLPDFQLTAAKAAGTKGEKLPPVCSKVYVDFSPLLYYSKLCTRISIVNSTPNKEHYH